MDYLYIKIAGIIVAILCSIIAIFQVMLAAGLPIGEYAWGGNYKILPKKLRINSTFAVPVLIFISILFLNYTNVINTNLGIFNSKILIWFFTVYFALNTVLNLASNSKKEKFLMSPLTIIVFICGIIVGLYG